MIFVLKKKNRERRGNFGGIKKERKKHHK